MFAAFRTPNGSEFSIRISSIAGYCETSDPTTRLINFLLGETSMSATVLETFEEIEKALPLPGMVKLRVRMRDDDGQLLLSWVDQAIDVDSVVGYHEAPEDHCVLLLQCGKSSIQLLAKTTIRELEKVINDACNEV